MCLRFKIIFTHWGKEKKKEAEEKDQTQCILKYIHGMRNVVRIKYGPTMNDNETMIMKYYVVRVSIEIFDRA